MAPCARGVSGNDIINDISGYRNCKVLCDLEQKETERRHINIYIYSNYMIFFGFLEAEADKLLEFSYLYN